MGQSIPHVGNVMIWRTRRCTPQGWLHGIQGIQEPTSHLSHVHCISTWSTVKTRIRTREYRGSLGVILSQLVVKLKEKGKKSASFDLHDWTATPLQCTWCQVDYQGQGQTQIHENNACSYSLMVHLKTRTCQPPLISARFSVPVMTPGFRTCWNLMHIKQDKNYIELRDENCLCKPKKRQCFSLFVLMKIIKIYGMLIS